MSFFCGLRLDGKNVDDKALIALWQAPHLQAVTVTSGNLTSKAVVTLNGSPCAASLRELQLIHLKRLHSLELTDPALRLRRVEARCSLAVEELHTHH